MPDRRINPMVLAVGDAAALALFAVLGLLTHREGVTLPGFGRNAGPLVVGWFVVALVVGLYRDYPNFGRLVVTWFLGVSLGLAIRAVLLSRDADESAVIFGIVTLAVTMALLGAWRLAAAYLLTHEGKA